VNWSDTKYRTFLLENNGFCHKFIALKHLFVRFFLFDDAAMFTRFEGRVLKFTLFNSLQVKFYYKVGKMQINIYLEVVKMQSQVT